MSEVIRYAVYGPDNLGISADGDLVRFEDYDALREQNRVLREALTVIQKSVNTRDEYASWLLSITEAALTAASQPAQKPSGPTVSCNVANCWSCKDATSQEGQHGSR